MFTIIIIILMITRVISCLTLQTMYTMVFHSFFTYTDVMVVYFPFSVSAVCVFSVRNPSSIKVRDLSHRYFRLEKSRRSVKMRLVRRRPGFWEAPLPNDFVSTNVLFRNDFIFTVVAAKMRFDCSRLSKPAVGNLF